MLGQTHWRSSAAKIERSLDTYLSRVIEVAVSTHRFRIHGNLLLLLACLPASGCSNPGVSALERAINAMQEVTDLLKSVKDAPSATAAMPEIEPTYTEMIE